MVNHLKKILKNPLKFKKMDYIFGALECTKAQNGDQEIDPESND